MNENNVFVLNLGESNLVLETIQWIKEGLLALNLVNSDPMCDQLKSLKKVQLYGVHNEARMNVFLNNEYNENCNLQYLCRIKECIEKDGETHFIIEVVKKIILSDFPSMTNSFFTKFLKKRLQNEMKYPTRINTLYENFGPYR